MQLNVEQARGHVAVPRTLRRVNLRRVIGMLSAMLHLLGGESCDNHLETTAQPWLPDTLLCGLRCRSLAKYRNMLCTEHSIAHFLLCQSCSVASPHDVCLQGTFMAQRANSWQTSTMRSMSLL